MSYCSTAMREYLKRFCARRLFVGLFTLASGATFASTASPNKSSLQEGFAIVLPLQSSECVVSASIVKYLRSRVIGWCANVFRFRLAFVFFLSKFSSCVVRGVFLTYDKRGPCDHTIHPIGPVPIRWQTNPESTHSCLLSPSWFDHIVAGCKVRR